MRALSRGLSSAPRRPVIVVHGGAWAIPELLTDRIVAGCEAAAAAGWEVLRRGGSALDAVETATRIIEDDPAFDAGHGAVINERGDVELDAIVMDGKRCSPKTSPHRLPTSKRPPPTLPLPASQPQQRRGRRHRARRQPRQRREDGDAADATLPARRRGRDAVCAATGRAAVALFRPSDGRGGAAAMRVRGRNCT